MAHDASDLIRLNRSQQVSESDDFTEERYAQFWRHLPSEAIDIMDVGCNTGRGGAIIKQRNPASKITGLDCVPERLAVLDNAVYDKKICSFAHGIPADSGSYDAIIAGEFLEHVPPEQVTPTLCEFFRLLRLRGRLLITTPNPSYLKNRTKGLSVLLDPSHLTQHFPSCLRQRLREIGFSNLRIRGSGRVSRILGERFPILDIYGSYLVVATKW